MRCFIGLGSNLGDRRAHLVRAAGVLQPRRCSPLYESAALVPPGAPSSWNQPFLNGVAELDWPGTPVELLQRLKQIEQDAGRTEAPRWAPRNLDLDLLLWGEQRVHEPGLKVPHPELARRSFVLDPLKDLAPQALVMGIPSVIAARRLPHHRPLVMAILNLTPDSFSDGGACPDVADRLQQMVEAGAQVIDLGAESTRPGATPVTVTEECRRLRSALAAFPRSHFRPWLSVDTRHAETAALALEYGADVINDVSGLSHPALLDVVAQSSCHYVLMHSLTVPADPRTTLPETCDVIAELKHWLDGKLNELSARGVAPERVIFDPGIGFGKSARQGLEILRRWHEFADLPVRLLVGHSRKSFLRALGVHTHPDAATLALSLNLARQGADIVRVHDFASHLAALKTKELEPC